MSTRLDTAKRRGLNAMILTEVESLYAYDSLGRKTSRMDNDTWEYYIYDGMNLVADYDAYNYRITRTYTYGPGIDNIQSMTIYDEYGGSETYYYIKDASNTVHVLVDEDGLIVEYYCYDAFGNVKIRNKNYNLITESVYGNRFLFQGREYDYDTALYYFRNRWYEPETGRWLSPDPIGISGGLNLYTFCKNDPVDFMDSFGYDALVVNGGGFLGHTSFGIIDKNGFVTVYHYYSANYQIYGSIGLIPAFIYDKPNIWFQTFPNLTTYLDNVKNQYGNSKILAYAIGTELDDELSTNELDELSGNDNGYYSIILGIDCHYASWEWFNEYLEGGIKNNSIDNQLCAPDFPKNLFFSKRVSLITLP